MNKTLLELGKELVEAERELHMAKHNLLVALDVEYPEFVSVNWSKIRRLALEHMRSFPDER